MRTAIVLLFLFGLISAQVHAQTFRGIDKSPMDMAYYPDDYAHDRKFAPQKIGGETAKIRVIYSRPAKNNRDVFGTKLAPYGKVWRVGANEAPEIKFYQNATIQGKPVKAGTYALLAIPNENEWTIILSSDLDQWGAYSYDEKKDVLRFNVPTRTSDEPIENFSIQFAKGNNQDVLMRMGWDKTIVEVPVTF